MTDLPSSAAKELSALGAAKGGNARANVLTPERRREIAQKAIAARWAKAGKSTNSEQVSSAGKQLDNERLTTADPIALFPGKLTIGDVDFNVYVLDNRKRVMVQREVVRVLTGKSSGAIASLVKGQAVADYIDIEGLLNQTIMFSIPGTQFKGIGYEATLLLDICDAYLRARADKRLVGVHQSKLAKQAEVITRACAKVGIIALIDEATGYQAFRAKQELQLKLQAFIAEDMQEWARMFPDEFWFELARLEGVRYSPRSRPLRWGKYIMAFVYDAVDGDVGKTLRTKNPNPHFKQNHHQWLKDFGRQKVHDQIERVITIMKLCSDMNDFRTKFAKVFKKTVIDTQLDFGWGKE
ncbi:MAG TPA: P63C domain-containing protein [Terracidiphilus sp.]|nr:P63C domain-containing protein [Terracidiphilus sp.]